MIKKFGFGLAGMATAIAIITAMAMASTDPDVTDLRNDIGVVIRGILSPRQVSVIMDFREDRAADHLGSRGDRPDPLGLWHELGLTRSQQERLIDTLDGRIDDIHPSFLALIETVSEIARETLGGIPGERSPEADSRRLGAEIGETAWRTARATSEARSVLTPAQVDLVRRHREEHTAILQDFSKKIGEGVDDLAALWESLDLAPAQVDALGVVCKYAMGRRHENLLAKHEALSEKVRGVLNEEQAAMAEAFHRDRKEGWLAHIAEVDQARERLRGDLALTGEQKIAFVGTLIDHRHRLGDAVQGVINPWIDLHAAVHGDVPDEAGVKAAAMRLGEGLSNAIEAAAGWAADAGRVLTAPQRTLVQDHLDHLLDRHLERAETLPDRVHLGVNLIKDLDLSEAQKDRIIEILVEAHQDKWDGPKT